MTDGFFSSIFLSYRSKMINVAQLFIGSSFKRQSFLDPVFLEMFLRFGAKDIRSCAFSHKN